MTRGEIWWVDFGLAFGSMTLGRRVALVRSRGDGGGAIRSVLGSFPRRQGY